MDTQWRIGMNGATGLDYSSLPFVLRVDLQAPRSEWRDLFRDLQVMEKAALVEIHKE